MTDLPKIPKSSAAVLNIAGVYSLEDCATWSARELAGLRGFGPKAFVTVRAAMAEGCLEFDESSDKRSDPVNVEMARERMKNAPVFPDGLTDLPFIGGPARSALAGIDVHDLADVSNHSKRETMALYGIGPKAVRILEPTLAAKGLSFRNESGDGRRGRQ